MKMLLKILLFPITFILTIVLHVSCFLVEKLSVLLNILSGLLFLGALIMGGFAVFKGGTYTWQAPILIASAAFIISPYGLPKLAEWFLCRVNDFNEFVKTI